MATTNVFFEGHTRPGLYCVLEVAGPQTIYAFSVNVLQDMLGVAMIQFARDPSGERLVCRIAFDRNGVGCYLDTPDGLLPGEAGHVFKQPIVVPKGESVYVLIASKEALLLSVAVAVAQVSARSSDRIG